MWMMGSYTDGADFNIPDSINGRKLLPARPMATGSIGPSLTPQCFRTFNAHDLLSFNHHVGTNGMMVVHEQQQQPEQVVVSTRWNPTPEQLQTLEELYRRGTRTPSADQIQHITAQLRRYGKIEGKNVFYWFQNHKARERHKRRRHEQQQQLGWILNNSERRELEVNRRAVIEVEETKGCMPSTNTSSTLAEKTGMARGEWIQFHEEGEMDKNNRWQMMQFVSCGQETNIVRAIMCPKIFNIPITNNNSNVDPLLVSGHDNHNEVTVVVEEESKTLQLFPLHDDDQSMSEKPTDHGVLDSNSTIVRRNSSNSSGAPCHFFEFLPMKN